MRRYELVTVVTDGHRIEGRRGVVLAFFGNILAFFGNKWAILQLFTMVTAVTDGPRWSQVVTVGHSWSQNRRGLGAPVEASPWCVCRLLRQSKKLIDIVGEPGKATGKPGSFS